MSSAARPTAAVIGAGVSGLTTAHVLNRTHQVTVYEADTRVGGHAHTHDVPAADGRTLRIDSGFIVHNERTYPHLLRLFRELDVPTQATEMSMSITCDACGLSYAGGRGLRGLLAQPSRLADPRFVRMLAEVRRFHRAARALLDEAGATDPTWGEFLAEGGSPTSSSNTSPSRSSPASGPPDTSTRSPTPPATCSVSSTTTGCSR